jgi:hypothetical protein
MVSDKSPTARRTTDMSLARRKDKSFFENTMSVLLFFQSVERINRLGMRILGGSRKIFCKLGRKLLGELKIFCVRLQAQIQKSW